MNQQEGQKRQQPKDAGRSAPVEQVGMLTRAADGREFSLGYGSLRIGRQRRADLVIDDKTVSRHHADICYESGRYVLYDHSTNGTWVNGRRMGEKTTLQHWDLIQVGETHLRFTVHDKTIPLS